MHQSRDWCEFYQRIIDHRDLAIPSVLRSINMRYGLLLCVTLSMCGCGHSPDPTADSDSRKISQPKAPDTLPTQHDGNSIGWQAMDIVGNKLHLVSEPNQIGLFRFDADGTTAAKVYDLGMVEMFWSIDTNGRLLICDDNDFKVLHSSLQLISWVGDTVFVYNEIKNRKEEYFREAPRPLNVEQLLNGGRAEPERCTRVGGDAGFGATFNTPTA